MKIKISQKILSIPPYISTLWSNIKSLHMKDTNLVITLLDQTPIQIPGLDPQSLETIFLTHATVLDQPPVETKIKHSHSALSAGENVELPFRLSFGAMEEIGSVMQHNPAQANIPEIPVEILNKILEITKIVSQSESVEFPAPEQNCNCVHCQIGKAAQNQQKTEKKEEEHEEPVSDEELTFHQWEIQKTGEQLYVVTNKLDTNEKYTIFLGDPVGCTCGKSGCEHIIAVLKS